MYKILFVDDEDAIREGFAEYAAFLGHTVTQARDGMEAVRLCRENDYDVIVLDIMMPRMDGFTACKEIRKEKEIPILMLSARAEEYDKLYGFDLGAEDYVTKPFSSKELLARINVLASRGAARKNTPPPDSQNEVYVFDTLVIDCTARIVTIDGKRLELTPKEYDLLF
ncbi:MAG: response regulator transcription factor, partial [Oscillospiraceae bacterium]|nr:response regulator transcription factor [Oscillospiraceae bacterium]